MNHSPTSSPTRSAWYCAGCNEVFVAEDGICPLCSMQIQHPADDLARDTRLPKLVPDALDVNEQLRFAEQLDQLIGRRLHCYEIESLLGRGGMGHVFLALHADLRRKCAVKVLCPSLIGRDRQFVRRFTNEARTSAALNHPNIVTTHAIGTAEGYHFLEMEYVPGRSLQRLMDEEHRMPPVRSTAVIAKIAEGLALAHQHNIVHRDLKPDNILMTPRAIPKIADFGLAKQVATSGDTRYIAGTPYFMAPELFNGQAASPSSDVYALGVCYFYLLTGRHPFAAPDFAQLMNQTQTGEVPAIRDLCDGVSFEMAECLQLMLAKSPRNRPRDGMAVAQLLQAVLGAVRDIESLLQDAFGGRGFIDWKRHGNQYELQLHLDDGRGQRVFLETSNHTPSEQLLMIYSICGDAKAEYHAEALRLNSEIPHGGLAIREIDGVDKFIMVDNYPRGTLDVEELRLSVMEVAQRADEFEFRISGRDTH